MTLPPSRILTAVPRTWQAGLEIAKAIRALMAQEDEEQRLAQFAGLCRDRELIAQDIREAAHDCALVTVAELRRAGFRPDQPRWRKGSGRISGRWSGDAGEHPADEADKPTRGGHHYVPRQLFDNEALKAETRRVFDKAVTGPLRAGVHENDEAHRIYNKAVLDLWKQFLERNGLSADEVTPDQASKFLDIVLHSNDPRIHDFNEMLQRR
jgi:hypothetical protein